MLIALVLDATFALWTFSTGRMFFLNYGEDLPEVFEHKQKTYVRFNHPLINLTVITASNCSGLEVCDTKTVLEEIRRNVSYGIKITEVNQESEQGQTLISSMKVPYLPAFLFDENLSKLDHFSKLQTRGQKPYFAKIGNGYILDYITRTKPAKILQEEEGNEVEEETKNDKSTQ